MPTVSFRFDAQLVSVRREVCPHARWDKVRRVWTMTPIEAQAFLDAGHAALYRGRISGQIAVDNERWLVGFVQGAPLRQA